LGQQWLTIQRGQPCGHQHHFERASGISSVASIATELLRYGKRALQYLTHWA